MMKIMWKKIMMKCNFRILFLFVLSDRAIEELIIISNS